MKSSNLMVIFNKADEDEDSIESVTAFYAEAHRQADCKHLPLPTDLNKSNVIILGKQKMGKKTMSMEQCVPQATALHKYIQGKLVNLVKEKLEMTKALKVENTTIDAI